MAKTDDEDDTPPLIDGVLSLFEAATGTRRRVVFHVDTDADVSAVCSFCSESTAQRLIFKAPGKSGSMVVCETCTKQMKETL